ncbi:MAG: protein-glutamate O-methyltransferase CheR [Planctomycetes bacterium]|nr:protein-glutamate O-methyltransferase CheR [Planctomycetota bacterium]
MQDLAPEEQLSDSLFRKISSYVYDAAKINLTDNKRELVKTRLGKIIRTRGFRGYRDYYEYMINDSSGEALLEVLNAVSTNLTSFFRESKHFDFLGQKLLPGLYREKNPKDARILRGWSAGCSSGEEVYTIAMTVLENFPDPRGWDIKLLASDIDTNVIAKGENGEYEKNKVESVPGLLRSKYFTRGAGGQKETYRVSPLLKELVVFRRLNLMGDWPFKRRFDFIFCRNVMIYFDRPTQEALVNRFHQHLAVGGYLFIGHSEGLNSIKHPFKYIQPTIYQKVSD